VLGGAGLAPIAPRVASMLDCPVIDGLAAAITAAEAAVKTKARRESLDLLTEPIASTGLTRELEALLQNQPVSLNT